jgi:N-acetylglucosamine-6-phosphate deacetylase
MPINGGGLKAIHIKNADIILEENLLKKSSISISGSKISCVGKGVTPAKNSLMIDAKGCFLSPGFIDTHIHGSPADIFKNETRYGTTAIVLALSCDRVSRIYEKIDEAKDFIAKDPFGVSLLGVRLEGPYISPEKAGAQDKRYIKQPDKRESAAIIKRCAGLLKIVTVAPELKGAGEIIKMLKTSGIIPSIGHSNATFEEALKGFNAGIIHATHLFNAMSKREGASPGAASAVMIDDRVMAEIILDGIHVPPRQFLALVMLKEISKIALVTDSVRAEKIPCMRKAGGVYRLRNGAIAGSSLTMISAVRNAVKYGGLSPVDAVRLASLNPATMLGVQDRRGSLAAGKDADVVMFDKNFDVKMTAISGRIAYQKELLCS